MDDKFTEGSLELETDHPYPLQYLHGVISNEFPNELPARIEEAMMEAKREIAPSTDYQELAERIRGKLART